MDYTIRTASEQDAPMIASLRVKLLDEASGPLPESVKAALLADNEAAISEGLRTAAMLSVLAFDGETQKPIGTCSITLYTVLPGIKLPNGKLGYLQNMYVAPAYRGYGIGRRLLSVIIEEAARRGHTKITLHATDRGKKLFRSFGFTEENVALDHLVYETGQ